MLIMSTKLYITAESTAVRVRFSLRKLVQVAHQLVNHTALNGPSSANVLESSQWFTLM